MDDSKQKLLIEYLISSPDTFSLCQSITKAEYFDPEYRRSVTFIKEYYEKYNTTPSAEQVGAETSITFKQREVSEDEIKYCSDEIETFCKRKAIESAILASPELINEGDYGTVEQMVKDAVTVSLNKNLGLDYFKTVEERLNNMLHSSPTISTMWTSVDDVLYGGLSRKELLLVSANSGGGKSLTLANLGFNYVQQGYNVLYISLELSAEIISQRYDTMFTGIGRQEWRESIDDIVSGVTRIGEDESTGNLDIIQLPTGSTANDIRAFLKDFYLHRNFMPDLLIVDYLDEMAPNEFVSADNVHEKDRRCTTQLRQIGVDEDMIVATASQLNRSAVNATSHDHSQIAGGISKINVADVYWSIIMNDAQRAAGEMLFVFQKTRNSDGVGKALYMKWENKTLRILDGDKNDRHENGMFSNTTASPNPTKSTNKFVDDLFGTDPETPNIGILELMVNTPK